MKRYTKAKRILSLMNHFWGFISKEFGTSESGKYELNEILGIDHGLETVKPTDLIKKLIFPQHN